MESRQEVAVYDNRVLQSMFVRMSFTVLGKALIIENHGVQIARQQSGGRIDAKCSP